MGVYYHFHLRGLNASENYLFCMDMQVKPFVFFFNSGFFWSHGTVWKPPKRFGVLVQPLVLWPLLS